MFATTSPAERFIACQPWFASLPLELQAQVRTGVYANEGAKGEVMLPAGTAVQGWHAVLSGLVMLRSPAAPQRRSSAPRPSLAFPMASGSVRARP